MQWTRALILNKLVNLAVRSSFIAIIALPINKTRFLKQFFNIFFLFGVYGIYKINSSNSNNAVLAWPPFNCQKHLFQAIQFSQTVLTQTIQFSISFCFCLYTVKCQNFSISSNSA